MCLRKKTGYTLVASQNRSIWRLLKAPKSTRLVTRSTKRQRLARNDNLVYISLDKGAPGKKYRNNLWTKWYLLIQKIKKRKGHFTSKKVYKGLKKTEIVMLWSPPLDTTTAPFRNGKMRKSKGNKKKMKKENQEHSLPAVVAHLFSGQTR